MSSTSGYSSFIELVGADNALSDERLADYCRDETFLQGRAEIALFPENHDQVRDIVLLANNEGASLTVRGLGSGLSGAAVPDGGIVLSLERMATIFTVAQAERQVHAQAGCVTADIEKAANSFGLVYPPAPTSAAVSAIGGNVATNAAGPASFKYGSTRNWVARLRVVWGDGSDDWVGALTRKSSVGLDLKNLLIGSEGQLGVVTEVVLRLAESCESAATLLIGAETYQRAGEQLKELSASGLPLKALELIDAAAVAAVKEQWPEHLRDAGALLIVEVEGSQAEVDDQLASLSALLGSADVAVASNRAGQQVFWQARRGITDALKRRARFKLGEDIAVPLSEVAHIIEYAHAQGQAGDIETVVWGHAGDGNLHINMLYNHESVQERVLTMAAAIAKETVRLGGSISGEHGLGRLKRHLQPLQESANLLQKQRRLKAIFDPNNVLNPALLDVTKPLTT